MEAAVHDSELPAEQWMPATRTIPSVCQICGEGESAQKRLCYFLPTELEPAPTVVHVFCGKIAAILPKINRPDLEILTKSGIKYKHGTGPCVLVALQRSRTCTIAAENNQREQVYYLVREVEDHLSRVKYQRDNRKYLSQESVYDPPQVPEPAVEHAPQQTVQSPHEDPSTEEYMAPSAAVTSASIPDACASMDSPLQDDSPHYPKNNTYYISPPTKEHLSPYEVYMERLQQVSHAYGAVGYSLVRPVSRAVTEEDYAEEDSENFDPRRCSQAQVDHVRVIIVTEARQKKMEAMARLVAEVVDAWRVFAPKYRNLKSWPLRFDTIVGFTKALKDNHIWMDDDGSDVMVTGMARLWKTLLRKSNDQLGIDGEFTRPGVMTLLQEFQEQVQAVDTEPQLEFRYEPV
jgi:hypothetical protein